MLLSLALIFLCGIVLGNIFYKLKLPSLVGMLLTGIILGPYGLNMLDKNILAISPDLREMALIVILIRAGLNLELDTLKKIGKSALFMCFVPASFEIIGMIVLAPKLLGLSLLEAALLGTVLAAVSPAVVVPKMLKLVDEKYGVKKGIPQLIMAGASVDDVYVIVIFTSILGLLTTGTFQATNLIKIPVSIVLGVLIGSLLGIIFNYFFKKVHVRDSLKVIILLSLSFILVTIEHNIKGNITFSGLLSIMSIGIILKEKYVKLATRLSTKFGKLWVAAELLLFVLVGATVNISYALDSGINVVILILGVLVFRLLGVYVSLLGTNFNKKERFFTMIAYSPKATVQAAIGGVPLSLGLASGNIILTVAVVSIIITAPLGSFFIDLTYKKFLECDTMKK